MEEIIKFKSRYKEKNYLKKLSKSSGLGSKTYVLKVDNSTLKVGSVEDGKRFIGLSGDPMIVVGYELKEAGAVAKSIDFVEGYGWTITFE